MDSFFFQSQATTSKSPVRRNDEGPSVLSQSISAILASQATLKVAQASKVMKNLLRLDHHLPLCRATGAGDKGTKKEVVCQATYKLLFGFGNQLITITRWPVKLQVLALRNRNRETTNFYSSNRAKCSPTIESRMLSVFIKERENAREFVSSLELFRYDDEHVAGCRCR